MLAVEYPGFGLHFKRGVTSTPEVKYEARKILRFLNQELGIKNKQLILFGRSMGTGVACYLASLL